MNIGSEKKKEKEKKIPERGEYKLSKYYLPSLHS
jgi:hypothetical protein